MSTVIDLPEHLDRILAGDDETDYWMFLNFAAQFDKDLLTRLIQRAKDHAIAEIQDLGQEFDERSGALHA